MKADSDSMLRLRWDIDQHGYEIVELEEELWEYDPNDPPVGLKKYIKGVGGPFTQYEPFSGEAAIHRDLADLCEETSDDLEVLAFCSRYGLIDQNHPEPFSLPKTVPGGVSQFRYGPTGRMMQSHETLSLDHFWVLQHPIRQAMMAIDRDDKDHAKRLFNEADISVVPRINMEAPRDHHPWQLIPINLKSAIWLLVEQEISNAAQWRRCKNCQTWFPKRTARGLYCEDACKTAFHRKNKKEA
jgi:hypothetical protein